MSEEKLCFKVCRKWHGSYCSVIASGRWKLVYKLRTITHAQKGTKLFVFDSLVSACRFMYHPNLNAYPPNHVILAGIAINLGRPLFDKIPTRESLFDRFWRGDSDPLSVEDWYVWAPAGTWVADGFTPERVLTLDEYRLSEEM